MSVVYGSVKCNVGLGINIIMIVGIICELGDGRWCQVDIESSGCTCAGLIKDVNTGDVPGVVPFADIGSREKCIGSVIDGSVRCNGGTINVERAISVTGKIGLREVKIECLRRGIKTIDRGVEGYVRRKRVKFNDLVL